MHCVCCLAQRAAELALRACASDTELYPGTMTVGVYATLEDHMQGTWRQNPAFQK